MCADLVSTIIPVFNRGEMLCDAVNSVLEQTHKNIEIIIVDDGSTDDTLVLTDNLATKQPDIIRVIHIENGGPGVAREIGRQAARGAYIQYLDSDDLLSPNKFTMQVAALESNPECGAAYGFTRLIDVEGKVLKAPFKWTGKKIDHLFPLLLVDRWWNTHTPLWRKSVCDAIGSWSDMRMSEDWEYEARAGALGVKLVHCPEYLSDTRIHPGVKLAGSEMTVPKLKDISRLITKLFECSMKVGVSLDTSEMKHFSRWAFLVARQAGAYGLTNEAEKCFDVALNSAGPRSTGLDFKVCSTLAHVFGWHLTGRALCWFDNMFSKNSSAATLKQSWMEQ